MARTLSCSGRRWGAYEPHTPLLVLRLPMFETRIARDGRFHRACAPRRLGGSLAGCEEEPLFVAVRASVGARAPVRVVPMIHDTRTRRPRSDAALFSEAT